MNTSELKIRNNGLPSKSKKNMKSKKRSKYKVKYKEVDFILLAVTLALVLFGLLMVFSASSYENVVKGFAAYKDVIRQGFFALVGLFIMIFVVSNFNYHRYTMQFTKLIVFVVLILNVAVILFDPTKGASRWIRIGPLSLQPSELAKFAMVLYAANALKRVGVNKRISWKPSRRVFLMAGVFAGIIIVLQSNLSIGAILMMTSLIMIFLAGVPFAQIFTYIGIGVSMLALAMIKEPYRMRRFLNFGDPFVDAQGDGHQLVQSLYALTSGGVFGRGIGMSRLKAFWLPEAQNDFIFAVVVEELGLLGGLFLIAMIMTLIWRGIRIALSAEDNFGKLLAIGITAIFALQSLINIAVVIGAFPVTGVTLPFISAGGTSLVVNLAAVGILMNISRQSRKKTNS
ncbi:MAG TPA: putative lipid II flippase FtsW [Proteiniclasticum sp.]|nr:putative lipid II flippase FtsW [Proteiniclasticum sp.]